MANSSLAFQEKLRILAESYAERLPEKLSDINEVWHQLETQWNKEQLDVLHRMVHSLTGSGKTFGFAELSAEARLLEQILKDNIQLCQPFGEAQCIEIEKHIGALHQIAESGATILPSESFSISEETIISNLELSGVKKIFIVDEEKATADELTLQLRYFGYNVEYFNQIEPFKSAARNHPEAIIIMNIEFSGDHLGGIHVINDLQEERDNPVQVIFVSANDHMASRLGAVRAGGIAYFSKPINSSELIDTLDSLTSTLPQEPYRVLIVDDSATLLSYHSAILEQVGMTVRTVQEPLNSVSSLLEFDPDLILMDLYMPDCSGLELSKVIRQLDRFVSIPIVYLSSESDFNTQLEAISLGGDDFLVKPIEPKQLISAVASRIQRARLLRSFMVRDSLTGLYNHTSIKEQLEREIARSNRLGTPLSFAMVDIDFFKKVNDTYGHPTGDRVIKSLARLLKQRLRITDIIGRYGGEEFAIVMNDTDVASAAKVLDTIRQVFAKLLHISDNKEFSSSFSCGVADIASYPDAVAIGNAADQALYRAKENGRDQVVQYPDTSIR